MAEDELNRFIHDLIFAETLLEQMQAGLELRSHTAGIAVLRPIFMELMRYIGDLLSGERLPQKDSVTPFLQFLDAFHPIAYLFWSWYEDEPIVEALISLLDDPDRPVRALALVSLGAGNIKWNDARVEPYLQTYRDAPDPLLRAAARLSLEYMKWGDFVEARTPPDMVRYQLIEQYAAQLMAHLVKSRGNPRGCPG